MLPKIHRLQLRFNREAVEKAGRKLSSPLFTVVYRKNSESISQPSRFAYVVSKKISKHAVVRNRVRRELVGLTLALLPKLESGYDLIIFVRPSAVTASMDEKKNLLAETFRKIGILSYVQTV